MVRLAHYAQPAYPLQVACGLTGLSEAQIAQLVRSGLIQLDGKKTAGRWQVSLKDLFMLRMASILKTWRLTPTTISSALSLIDPAEVQPNSWLLITTNGAVRLLNGSDRASRSALAEPNGALLLSVGGTYLEVFMELADQAGLAKDDEGLAHNSQALKQ